MNFQELMDSYCFSEYESNEYRYKLLLEKMKKHRILPVIGSGLSCWAFPSWHEFLLDLASQSSVEEEARELLKKGRYTECATLLESDLGYDLARIVCDRYTFHGDDELKRPEYQKLIPLLFPRGAVTTNVDQSLETLYKNPYVLNPAPEEEMYSRFMDAALSARRQ